MTGISYFSMPVIGYYHKATFKRTSLFEHYVSRRVRVHHHYDRKYCSRQAWWLVLELIAYILICTYKAKRKLGKMWGFEISKLTPSDILLHPVRPNLLNLFICLHQLGHMLKHLWVWEKSHSDHHRLKTADSSTWSVVICWCVCACMNESCYLSAEDKARLFSCCVITIFLLTTMSESGMSVYHWRVCSGFAIFRPWQLLQTPLQLSSGFPIWRERIQLTVRASSHKACLPKLCYTTFFTDLTFLRKKNYFLIFF